MNKIYKVIWSKVRNCYVAVSEIAKRNGKSCTSVNCGAKANRGNAGVALAVALSLSMTGGGVAWAYRNDNPYNVDNSLTVNDNTYKDNDLVLIKGSSTGSLGSGATVTIGGSGNVKSIRSSNSGNTINLSEGGSVTDWMPTNIPEFQNLTSSIVAGVNHNRVSINGNVIGGVTGGYSTESSVTVTDNQITISGSNTTVGAAVHGGFSIGGDATSNTVTIQNGNKTKMVQSWGVWGGYSSGGSANDNHVVITNTGYDATDPVVDGTIYGGQADNSPATASASKNTVSINNAKVVGVYGGESESGTVGGQNNGNRVSITDATVTGNVYGGSSTTGSVSYNEVAISGSNSNISASVYGGYSGSTGAVTKNTVTIEAGTVSSEVYGGYTYQGTAGGNSSEYGNTVAINGGTVSKDVFGGYVHRQSGSAVNNSVTVSGTSKIGTSTAGTTIYSVYGGKTNNGSATQNTVTINLTTGETTEETGKIFGSVYGGHSSGSGAVTKNTVNIEAGTVNVEVYGGYSTSGKAGDENARNVVNITNGNASKVYGGRSNSGSASYNTVNITNGSAVNVYGGITGSSTTGGASHNIVNLTDSVVPNAIYGGSSKGNVTDNVITINKGSYEGVILGGYGTSTAGVSGNKVIISDGNLIGGQAVGGYHEGSGNVTGNSLTISGGTINKDIYGGEAYSGNATDNTVVISGGSFTGNRSIYGGALYYGTSDEKSVDGNIVTIAGGGFTNTKNIYGGRVYGSGTATPITNNTVNLYGTVTGLTNAHFYGAYYNSDSTIMGTGNEFHIGGTKTAAMLAESTSAAAWTGTTDNKVASVNNFNSIVLHNVNWSTTTPVLAAGNFSNIGLLDVSNIELQGELSLGTMALLQLVTDSASGSLNQTNLTYKDTSGDTKTNQNVAEAEISISPSLTGLGTNAVIHTGVKADYDGIALVERKSDGKSINLTIAPEFKSVTLGEMNWADGGYSFSTPGRITGDGLAVILDNFKVTGAEDQGNNSQLNLLSIPSGMSAIKDALNENVTVTLPDVDVKTGLTFSASRVDTVATDANKRNLIYTTGATNKVKTATFGAGVEWNTTMPYYNTAGSVYTFDNATAINVTGLTISFTDAQKAALQKDNSMTLISATGITSSTGIAEQPTTNTYAVSNTSTLGTQFGATATGTVAAETGAVKYKISSVDVNTITLGSRAWGSTDSLPETWTASGNTSIDASLFTFTGKAETALAIGNTAPILTGTGLGNSTVTNQPGEDYGKVTVDYTDTKGIKFDATAKGIVEAASNAVNYKVSSVTLKGVDLKNWDGTVASPTSAVPTGWTAQDGGVAVYTNNMTNLPTNLAPGGSVDILTGSAGFFTDTRIQGANKYWNGDAFNEKPTGETGIAIAGNKVGGVKAENIGENVGAKLTYYAEKKSVSTITLGTETFTNGRTVYGGAESEFTNMYDATGATINTDALAFSNSSVMEAGDSMTVLDASKAIKDGSGHALPAFTTQKTSFVVGFTDEVTDKGLTFKGTHTDTLSQDSAQTKILYTVGSKTVSGDDAAALTGTVTWSGGGTHYTNSKYTFDSTAKTNLSGLTFGTTNEDPYGKSMTLISGSVDGTVSNAPASFGVSLAKTNTTLEATAAGSASIDSGDLKYTVNGVTIDKINVKQVSDTAEVLPTGWVLKKSGSTIATTVETGTGTTAMTTPSGLNPGDTRVIFTAGESLEGITINGDFKWKEDNSDLPGTAENGVVITGKQTKGGVRVNTANTNQLIYEESKKNVTGISFSETVFENGKKAVELDKNFDATGAAIDPDGLTFTEASRAIMETGNTMTMVDATAAIQNASNETLVMFGGKTYNPIAFTDTVTPKNLTFVGTHTDTLSQADDTATSTKKSKLVYTVGDKKVSTATLTGAIAWSDGGIHYTNGSDANQNGTKATYTFDGNSAVDLSGVAFSATADPLAGTTKSMTLLKGVTGVVATKVSGTPSFTVTLDQTNTKLDASASGSAGVGNSDVTYTVSGVAINKVNIKSVGSTADTIPANWTLASGAKVLTDNMTEPSNLGPGETKVIITATGTDYFSGVEVKGGYAWTSGGALTSDLEAGGVTIAGTQTKGGVKVNEANKNQLIYEETKKKLTSITLGEVTFAKDGTARAFDKTYDATSATINANNLKFTEASRAIMETGNSMTIVDATGAIINENEETLAQFNGGADKTYSIAFTDTVTGKNLTLAGTHTDTLSQEDDAATSTKKSKLVYTVGDKKVSTATLTGAIAWNDGGTHYTNGIDANQNGTKATYKFDGSSAVDISGVAFSATSNPLGKSMTLLQDVNGVVATKVSGTPSFTVALDQTNTKLDANATGTSGVSANDVTFTVNGVTLDKITVKGVGDTADTVPTGWNLASGATVETDGLRVSDPSGLNPGETKAIITATGTDYFNGIKLNGSHVWNVDGSPLTSDLEVGGVTIAGTQTAGGVKVDEANKSQLIYEESKKNVTSITLEEVAFAKNGTARAFDKTYDATGANINADNLKFTEATRSLMTSGSSMTIVDASAAIQNAGGNALPSFTAKNYDSTFTDSVTDQLTLTGTRRDTLAQDAAQTKLTYTVGDRVVSKAAMSGEVAWQSGDTHYANTAYTFNSSTAVDIANVKFTATDDPLNTSMTLIGNAAGVTAGNVSGSPDFTVALKNTTITATATGNASMDAGDLKYTVTGVTLDSVSVNGVGSDAIPAGWGTVANVKIDTDDMTVPADAAYGKPQVIMTASNAIFADDNITGSKKYGANPARFTDEDSTDAVVIVGKQDSGVKASADGKSLLYEVGKKEASSVTLAQVDWAKGATVFDGSSEEYDYSGIQSLGTGSFDVSYSAPETVTAGDNMTLLQANATLKNMAAETRSASYSFAPVSGVTIDAAVTGSLEAKGGNVTYTAKANQAGKLTFTNVDWKDSGALMTRPSNITFAGADVDTAKIHFQNMKELDANREMTLVSDFGDSVGTITGTKYMVGAGLEGEGAASLSGSDLVFTTKTEARDLAAQEQTHNTLMVMEAGMSVLAAGNEHVGQAMAELGNPQNAGLDGTVTAASLGGSKSRYKTGSHVDSNSWNVAVAVGSKRELTKGSLEWGVFGEYGKSNYTLHSDAGRGDGDSHYAGGGLMAKWTNKHDVYTEASVRLGRLSDTASNLLRDAAGNGYGYDVHANYFGAHVGVGKIIHYKGGKSLDVYGKYFYTKREGVDFTSGGNNYSLDSVASSVLRVGARYGTTDKKWNWYGGLAYEYEFDGKSEGTVDGVGIRAASVKGGSVRGEIGMRMNATKTNPWQTDISIYGYGGKHRGFGGSVNVAYMF